MEIIITGEAKEIAALVSQLQEQPAEIIKGNALYRRPYTSKVCQPAASRIRVIREED